MVKNRNYWKRWEHIDHAVDELIGQLGHYPSYLEMKEYNGGLLKGIQKHHGGVIAVRKKKNYDSPIHEKGYWNDQANLMEEVRIFMEDQNIDQLPSSRALIAHGASRLNNGINNNGGYRKLRDLLGEEQKIVESGTWMDINNCIAFAQKIKEGLQVKVLPDTKTLRRLGYSSFVRGLHVYHGGLTKFRGAIGEKNKRRESHLLRDISQVLEEAMKYVLKHDYKYLPSQKRLDKAGQSSLSSAIKRYHGGFISFREELRRYMQRPSENYQLETMLKQYAGGQDGYKKTAK